MRAEQAAAAQLRAKGIEPSTVKTVIMTHLHPDHASAISDFPEATFLVSTAEWEAATEGGRRDGYVKRQFDHGFEYRLVDFDSDDANSFSGFARAFDVFGDGSVRLVVHARATRAGTCRWCSRPSSGEVLVAGDAIFMRRTLDDDHLPHMLADEHLFRRSLREIKQYMKETPDAVVIPGHDWEAWEQLEAELLGQPRQHDAGVPPKISSSRMYMPSRWGVSRSPAWSGRRCASSLCSEDLAGVSCPSLLLEEGYLRLSPSMLSAPLRSRGRVLVRCMLLEVGSMVSLPLGSR